MNDELLDMKPSEIVDSLLQEYFPDRIIKVVDSDIHLGYTATLKKGSHFIQIEFYGDEFNLIKRGNDPLNDKKTTIYHLTEKIRFVKHCHDDGSIDNGIMQHGKDFYPVGAKQ
jgi:hypothetical protein